MTKLTAHELENAYDELKAENDRLKDERDDFQRRFETEVTCYNIACKEREVLRKAIEEALPKIYPLCPSLNIPNHHCLIKDTIESLKKALEAGKEGSK